MTSSTSKIRLAKTLAIALAVVATILCLGVLTGKTLIERRWQQIEARSQRIQEEVFSNVLNNLNQNDDRWSSVLMQGDTFDNVDAKLKRLEAYSNLKKVVLEETDVTDRGLASVAKIPNLETFALTGGRAGDNGIAHLRGNTSLINVALCCPNATEKSIETLQTLPNLDFVYFVCFCCNQPTSRNSVVEALSKLQQVTELRLDGAWVTDEILSDLQAALPNAKVSKGRRPYEIK